MKSKKESELQTLSDQEILSVSGAGQAFKEARAQDMYGNTVSMEEYMRLQRLAASRNGDSSVLSDFYDKGFNGNKPNIYF